MEDDDSCSDGEWKGAEIKKGKGQKLSRIDAKRFAEQPQKISETETKTRYMPRRAVTLQKKRIIESRDVDSESDEEVNE